MKKIVQTAGRNQLGTFAPEFAHFNDGFTKPSRGTSEARVEQESTGTLSSRCDCERCRLMRGAVGRKRRKFTKKYPSQ